MTFFGMAPTALGGPSWETGKGRAGLVNDSRLKPEGGCSSSLAGGVRWMLVLGELAG